MIVFYQFYALFLGDCDATCCTALATALSREQVMTARDGLWIGPHLRTLERTQKDLRTPVLFKSSPCLWLFKMFLRRLEFVVFTVLTHSCSVSSLVRAWGGVARTLPAPLGGCRTLPWTVAHEILPARAVKHSRGTSTTSRRPRSTLGGEEIVRWPALGVQCRPGPVFPSGAPGIPCLPAGRSGWARAVPPALVHPTAMLKKIPWTSRNRPAGRRVETATPAAAVLVAGTRGWSVPRAIRRGPQRTRSGPDGSGLAALEQLPRSRISAGPLRGGVAGPPGGGGSGSPGRARLVPVQERSRTFKHTHRHTDKHLLVCF